MLLGFLVLLISLRAVHPSCIADFDIIECYDQHIGIGQSKVTLNCFELFENAQKLREGCHIFQQFAGCAAPAMRRCETSSEYLIAIQLYQLLCNNEAFELGYDCIYAEVKNFNQDHVDDEHLSDSCLAATRTTGRLAEQIVRSCGPAVRPPIERMFRDYVSVTYCDKDSIFSQA